MCNGRNLTSLLRCLITAAAVMPLAGCMGDVMLGFMPSGHDGAVTPEEVLIRFENRALTDAVNVDFYATNDPLETAPDDLFVEENRVTTSIGVAGTGIIEPLRTDSITFPCTEDLAIGTTGGSFSNNETGTDSGVGDPQWIQQSQTALCGHTITFKFAPDEDGFVTTLTIDD